MGYVAVTPSRGWKIKPEQIKWDIKDKSFKFRIVDISYLDYASCNIISRSVSVYSVYLEGA